MAWDSSASHRQALGASMNTPGVRQPGSSSMRFDGVLGVDGGPGCCEHIPASQGVGRFVGVPGTPSWPIAKALNVSSPGRYLEWLSSALRIHGWAHPPCTSAGAKAKPAEYSATAMAHEPGRGFRGNGVIVVEWFTNPLRSAG